MKVGLLAALAFLLVPACSDDIAVATGPEGLDYISTEVVGPPIPGGGPLELAFADDQMSFYAGCNRGTGSVDLSNGIVVVTNPAVTKLVCPGEATGSDAWIADLLRKQPQWTLDANTLTLTAGEQVITLVTTGSPPETPA